MSCVDGWLIRCLFEASAFDVDGDFSVGVGTGDGVTMAKKWVCACSVWERLYPDLNLQYESYVMLRAIVGI